MGVLLIVVAASCGDDDSVSGSDAGGGGDGGGSCTVPDTTCPDTAPIDGAPCAGDLMCDFTEGTSAMCVDGAWQTFDCPGCAPPLAESCRDPSTAALAGATVEIGPTDGAFRPFTDGERIRPSFGGQGGAMVAYRVRVNHADAPVCSTVTATVTLDAMSSAPARFPLKLHCGESLGVFTIFPDSPCEFRDYDVSLTVEVEGAGSTSATLVLEGGMCPRTLGG